MVLRRTEGERVMAELDLGVVVALEEGPKRMLERVATLGFPTCQVTCWHSEWLNEEVAERLWKSADAQGVQITTMWVGMPGRYVWNLVDGPGTIGLVPEWTRANRLEVLKRGADFAEYAGIGSVTSHVGFIPDDPHTRLYHGLVNALKEIGSYCAQKGQQFWFETGQETPVTLLRTIEDVNTGNLGINLDPANLLMYGKANPVDAVRVFGDWVTGVHAKDGVYPTDGRSLGAEMPLGEGEVDFVALLEALLEKNYEGVLTIEREISGPQQTRDVIRAKRYLEDILARL